MEYSLKRLLQGLTNDQTLPELEITGLSDDSRTVRSGDLFLARAGHRTSGVLYIEAALRAGAAAVLVEAGTAITISTAGTPVIPVAGLEMKVGIIAARYYGHPSAGISVVGVTGTNGKTTVSYAVARVLENVRKGSAGLIGTLGVGQSGHLAASLNTTPGAIRLQQILLGMKDMSISTVVMEVSSHGLDQGRVSGIRFHTAVFTNLTQDHLDYHGDMEMYAAAKKQLFLAPGLEHAVINTDDPYGARLSKKISDRLHLIAYGLEDKSPGSRRNNNEYLSGVILESRLDHLRLEVNSPWGGGQVDIHAGGRFNAYNFLAGLAVLYVLDIPFDQALRELPGVFPIPGRIETFRGRGNFTVVVDYAHTPDALENVLGSLREVCAGRLICVFGCGGDRDKGKRPRMGEIAGRYADLIILTNDNPRSEQPEAIINDILAGITDSGRIIVQADRAEAISSAIGRARADDIILVAGKGHETYQEIGQQRYPFNDRQLVRNLLGDGA
jgi:UDP-N-acetylmuramoyl-L-alanyl-D-glutamate--2,6-diaminopimelate ligase